MNLPAAHTKLQKDVLRTQALELRKKLEQDADFILESASLIATNLLSIPEVRSALCRNRTDSLSLPTFASYAPSKGEPNPNGFLDILEQSGGVRPNMAFPRVSGKGKLSLHFALLEELLPGSFGIPEPGADLPLVDMADIDVMLVPGVAFDVLGNRLGYGKGFYDRLLSSSVKLPLLIGISFDEALYGELPAETHDIKMNYIITPTRIVKVVAGI